MQNKWIRVKDRLPNRSGQYLCASGSQYIKTAWFSKNLYKVDKYDFADKKGKSGFYNYDSEWGYYETDVAYWMPLPKLPKGLNVNAE